MIVLDKPKLKFLLAGRTITLTVPHDRFRRGHVYSVGTAHNKPATCTATVTAVRVTTSGRELEIIQNRDSEDLFMARYSPHGYTSKLGQALGCEDAPVVDPATQARFSKEARERDQDRVQAKRQSISMDEQLRELQQRAGTGDQQAKRHLFMIGKHLDEAAKQKARDAA